MRNIYTLFRPNPPQEDDKPVVVDRIAELQEMMKKNGDESREYYKASLEHNARQEEHDARQEAISKRQLEENINMRRLLEKLDRHNQIEKANSFKNRVLDHVAGAALISTATTLPFIVYNKAKHVQTKHWSNPTMRRAAILARRNPRSAAAITSATLLFGILQGYHFGSQDIGMSR